MRALVFLTAVIVLTAAVVAVIKSGSRATVAMDAPRSRTVSIDELHRRVNMRSLPELDIVDPF